MMVISQKYGKVVKEASVSGIALSESLYGPSTRIEKHRHEPAYFCMLLQGNYRERYDRKIRECGISTVVFHPSNEEHSTDFGPEGGRLFRFELSDQWLGRIGQKDLAASQPLTLDGGVLFWLQYRLYEEFQRLDDFSSLAIEGLTLEIVAELRRRRQTAVGGQVPPWLEYARQLIQDQFKESLMMGSIASAVGVHPVHLARSFRQYFGCNAGDYVRQLRIKSASRELVTSDLPLADIAVRNGFSDQGHLSRTFKRFTGLTPGKFRLLGRPR